MKTFSTMIRGAVRFGCMAAVALALATAGLAAGSAPNYATTPFMYQLTLTNVCTVPLIQLTGTQFAGGTNAQSGFNPILNWRVVSLRIRIDNPLSTTGASLIVMSDHPITNDNANSVYARITSKIFSNGVGCINCVGVTNSVAVLLTPGDSGWGMGIASNGWMELVSPLSESFAQYHVAAFTNATTPTTITVFGTARPASQ